MLLALNTDRYCEVVFVLGVGVATLVLVEPWLARILAGGPRVPGWMGVLARRSVAARASVLPLAHHRFARARGWQVEARLPMPLDDDMLVLVHPADARAT